MFLTASAFDQNIAGWDTSNVITMFEMFNGASAFNQDLGDWNTSKVTTMANMFEDALAFNQPLGDWNTASVIDMGDVFNGALALNQDIGNWDTSNVTDMYAMFGGNSPFNQDIGDWNVSKVTNMSWMFNAATLSTANYDSILLNWSKLPLQSSVTFHGGSSTYHLGPPADARGVLTGTYSWTITDGGSIPATPTDINVWQVDGYDLNSAVPPLSYDIDGNLTILFRVVDAGAEDLNFNMWYGATSGAKTNEIVRDVNLSMNADGGSCDTNSKSGMVCTYDWDISAVADGNYWITIEINDGADMNTATSDTNFMVDNTAPAVTISEPEDGSSATGADIDLTYSAIDTNSGVRKYYVQVDSEGWIDNGTDLTYTFTSQAYAEHTVYVLATDYADNNSSAASATVTLNQPSTSAPGGLGSCSQRGGVICAKDEKCTGYWTACSNSYLCCKGACFIPEGETGAEAEPAQPSRPAPGPVPAEPAPGPAGQKRPDPQTAVAVARTGTGYRGDAC